MKQLTKDQIQELFDFAKGHRVRYYDLQSEVVDHLASAIENKWAVNPNLPFQTALNQVYKDFGIYGFGKLEQEKMEAIQRKVGWKVWAFVKSYLTIPKIGLTLLMVVSIRQLFNLLPDPFLYCKVGLYIIFALFLIVFSYKRFLAKDLLKKYLEVNAVYAGGFPFLGMFVFGIDLLVIGKVSPIFFWILSVWLTLSILAAIGSYQYLIKTVEEVRLRYESQT